MWRRRCPALFPERVDKGAQGRSDPSLARVIEHEARIGWAPVLEHAHELALADQLDHLVVEHQRHADAGHRGIQREAKIAEGHAAAHIEFEFARTLLELPFVEAAAGE